MNGIKCFISRDEVKNLVAAEVARRLEPERLLGRCETDVTLFDDGRVEITFYRADIPMTDEATVHRVSAAIEAIRSDSMEPARKPRGETAAEPIPLRSGQSA